MENIKWDFGAAAAELSGKLGVYCCVYKYYVNKALSASGGCTTKEA